MSRASRAVAAAAATDKIIRGDSLANLARSEKRRLRAAAERRRNGGAS